MGGVATVRRTTGRQDYETTGLRDNWQKHNRKLAHEWVANEYQVARVPVLEGGGNSAVEVDRKKDGNLAKVVEEARAAPEKPG